MRATQTHLALINEMTPGMVATIRNSVINQVVALAAKELHLDESQLVIRDIRPYNDLGMKYCQLAGSARTTDAWEYDVTYSAVGYASVTGDATMGDQRYVALFGVRDYKSGYGDTKTCTESGGRYLPPESHISNIKIAVGGAIKAIWDISGLGSQLERRVAFSPSAVIIPQNASYNISYYIGNIITASTALVGAVYLQLVGVVVEPRGKVITP